MNRLQRILAFSILITCCPPASVTAGEATDALTGPINEIVAILQDPQYAQGDGKLRQRERLWAVTQRIFDYIEISKRVLARSWLEFSPQQRRAFTEEFSRLLEFTYTRKVQEGYQDNQVVFLAEERLSDAKALVHTKIVTRQSEIPVSYSMLRAPDGWRIYDVRIEGVSLVQNYRTQFSEVLVKESPDQLIERVRRKVAEQSAEGV